MRSYTFLGQATIVRTVQARSAAEALAVWRRWIEHNPTAQYKSQGVVLAQIDRLPVVLDEAHRTLEIRPPAVAARPVDSAEARELRDALRQADGGPLAEVGALAAES